MPLNHDIKHVVNWCNENHLVLNASKTKELVIDFRKRPLCQYPVVIGDTCVNVVRSYKYLGTGYLGMKTLNFYTRKVGNDYISCES